MKLVVPRQQLQAFRAACRLAYPCETMAVLRGTRAEDGSVVVTEIKAIPHVACENGILQKGYERNMLNAKIGALRAGSEFVGTIHSHCGTKEFETCEHPSPADIKSALKHGEVVFGIVYVWDDGHRTEVSWYVPTPLPEVEYN